MPELERYILHRLAELDVEVRAAYDKFDFKAVWRKVLDFASMDLSAFFLDIRKDSLYCDHENDTRRRAVRTVMNACFDRLSAWLAPICVFTMEEAWMDRHGADAASVHLRQFPQTPSDWKDDALAADWAQLRRIRRVVTGALEIERREKRIGASLEASPTVYLQSAEDRALIEGRDLSELFITSSVTVEAGEGPVDAFRLEDVAGVAATAPKVEAAKCERCWRYTGDVGKGVHPLLCLRCCDVVDRQDAVGG